MNPFDPFSFVSFGAKEMLSAARDPVAYAKRAEATARNAAEWVSQGGGLKVNEAYSPYAVMTSGRNYKLRRYFPDDAPQGLPALVFVPPLMIKADVYDIAQRSSPVRAAHENGLDVWVVDFGPPEDEPGGVHRCVADHVLALSDVVDDVRRITGRNVVLSGYSQGGLFGYQTTAYRRNDGVDSIVTFGSVVDFQSGAPLPVPMSPQNYQEFAQVMLDLGLFRHGWLPGWANLVITKMIDPVSMAEFYVNYFQQLHDRDQIMRFEKQRRFLDQTGWVAYPGPAMNELMEYVAHNRLLTGGLVIGDRALALSDIEAPIFIAVGENDAQGPPAGVRAIRGAAPRADVYELTLNTGHFGIIASSAARKWTWPRVAGWIRWRAGRGEFPEGLVPGDQVTSTRTWSPSAGSQRVRSAVDRWWELSRTTLQTVNGAVGQAQAAAKQRGRQIPLLNRLDGFQPATTTSLGLLLDEAAERDPEGAALLFGDRVIRQRELKHGVDSTVKRLISVGVRQGDRVGVLMRSVSSAFGVVAAINRLGAAAVLLRPNGELAIEARLGGVAVVVSDPEHAADRELPDVRWCVLRGADAGRNLPAQVTDLDRIDPETVQLPVWYRPNPHRGADVSFVLFTGEGPQTVARAVTNRRWALSALSTAKAAALKRSDTVYVAAPLHQPSALLVAVGGAIAAGSRLALASRADRDTFWAEVRRYGATHVSYAGMSLREIADGPQHLLEQGHPIRVFLGSGMPANLWRRVKERFCAAKVIEFYAPADGEATLANAAGNKIGSVGRPLPGTAEVAIVAYDPTSRRFVLDSDGLARQCRSGEAGLLLARVDPLAPADPALRGVFAADDVWQSTGNLFTRDADGDLWFVDPADALVPAAQGWLSPGRVRDALGRIACVDLAVVYGVPNGKHEALVAAVTLFDGAELGKWDLEFALRDLAPAQRPHSVQVVPEIPAAGPLREAGLPQPARGRVVWRREAGGGTYKRITATRAK